MMKKLLLVILVVALGWIAFQPAQAEFRITTLNLSTHFDNRLPYNETHNGIGIELPLTDKLYLGLMQYTNSFYQESRAMSLTAEFPYKDIFWGPTFAIADGYGKEPLALAGIAVRHKIIRVTFTPVLIAAGLVFEFN